VRSRFSSLLGLVAAFALVFPLLVVPGPDGDAVAQKKERRKPPETKKVQAVREWAFKRLGAAQEALAANDYATLVDKLEEMERSTRLNTHETALMHQTWAYYYSEKEDYKSALVRFEQAIATGGLPTNVELSVRYNIGQLYIVTEQYRKGIDALNAWFELTEVPTADAYILLANAWVQLDDYRTALPLAKKAIEMSRNNPREGWWRLLLALHFQLEQYPDSAKVLEELVRMWPKKTYWMQLSSVYAQIEREHKSLTALEVAYREGYLTESKEIVRLAQMYLYHEIPHQAGKVLAKGFEDEIVEETEKNYELLANSWIRAQELDLALEPLGRAAKLSEDGNLYMRIGQIHVEAEDWKKAESSLNTAIKKGELDRPGLANLLLGIAQFNSGKLSAARRSFTRATKYQKTRKSGRQWLRHVAQELA
jgi:tetratricopeptide (TPR) repeat protein